MPLARMPVKTHGIKINLNGVGGLRTCIHLQEHRATNFAERLRRALLRLPGAGRQGPRAASPGAIVKGEHGLPVRARSYGNRFRDIARAAGIPDVVWNMVAHAGGATEAGAPRSFRKSPKRAIASAPRKMTPEQRQNRPSESV